MHLDFIGKPLGYIRVFGGHGLEVACQLLVLTRSRVEQNLHARWEKRGWGFVDFLRLCFQ